MAGGANTAIIIGLGIYAAGAIFACLFHFHDLPNQLLNKRANGESGKAATFNHDAAPISGAKRNHG